MRGKPFTAMQEAIIKDMFHRGASINDIAKRIGRTYTAVYAKLERMGLSISQRDEKRAKEAETAKSAQAAKVVEPVKPAEPVEPAEPVKEAEPAKDAKATRKNMPPRDMIRSLYCLGYRIKGDDLYQIVEKKVSLSDIVGNGYVIRNNELYQLVEKKVLIADIVG